MNKYTAFISLVILALNCNAKDEKPEDKKEHTHSDTEKNWRDRIEESAYMCDPEEKSEMPPGAYY